MLREPVQPIAAVAISARIQSSIGKSWSIVGEITGAEPLFIDCQFDGSINLPDHLVTIGPNGRIKATVLARDIVVMGETWGSLIATNRLEIRTQGAVTGDVTASRLIIEDGAFFKGNIDIVKQVAEPETKADATIDAVQAPWVRKASQSEAANLRMQPIPMSA